MNHLLHNPEYPQISYCKIEGIVYRINPDGSIKRRMFPDDVNMIAIYVKSSGKFTRRKQNFLAWEILNNKPVPEGLIIYPKDMDYSNIKGNNLGICSKEEYSTLKDALNNIQYVLKIICTELFYKVRYKVKGRTCFKKFHYEGTAKKFEKDIRLASTRLLNKYFVNK